MRDESEYEEARRLLAPLSGEPTGPARIDIQRAIADGRRRIRMRRVAGIGAAAVVGTLVVAGLPVALDATGDPDRSPPVAAPGSPTVSPSPPPSPVPSAAAEPAPAMPTVPVVCDLDLLPEPDGAFQSLVTAADPTGRFIAGRSYTDIGPEGLQIQVLVWDDGEPTPLEVPGLDPHLTDLNSSGVGVGVSYPAVEEYMEIGWVYQDGEIFALAGNGISGLERLTISEEGAVAGSRPSTSGGLVPVVWRTPTAEPEDLSVPGPEWDLVARAVDVDGTVLGTGYQRSSNPDPAEQAFVWLPDGTRRELPMPLIGGEPAHRFQAEYIDGGVVTGLAARARPEDGGEVVHVVRYDLRTGEFEVVAEHPTIRLDAWNRHGWAAGNGLDGLTLWGPTGDAVPLRVLDFTEPANLTFNLVATISDDGRIVAGQVDGPEGNAHAARWRCS